MPKSLIHKQKRYTNTKPDLNLIFLSHFSHVLYVGGTEFNIEKSFNLLMQDCLHVYHAFGKHY